MHDGGGGGGVAGTTNWVDRTVDDMWPTLANQQTNTHWQHVAGWRKTSELSSIHLSRLKRYRDSLAEAWPPEKNEAARAYVTRLDFLIETVQGIYDTSVANHQTLTGVTQAIWESRRSLEPIYNQYQAKKQAKQQYDAEVAANSGRPPAGKTPTTQSDLDELDWQARHIMYGLSSELATAQIQLRKPPKYKQEGDGRTGGDDPGGSSSAMGGTTPPVFSPVVPVTTGGGAHYTPTPTPPAQTIVTTTSPPGLGPILGSAPPITTPPVTPTPPSLIPPAPTPTPGPGLPGPIPPGLPPGARPPGMPPTSGFPTPSAMPPGGKTTAFGPNAGMPPRAMPPGGMIGGAPGSGLTQPTTGAGAARRINPVGGVIGGGGAGTSTTPLGGAGPRPGSGMGSGQMTGMGSGARAGNRSSEEQDSLHWDPDNPWETDEGVAPVMMPGQENGRIDPGPAIGYKR